MNHSKRLFPALLAAILCCTAAGCGEEIPGADSAAEVTITLPTVTTTTVTTTETTVTTTTTTASPWKDIARGIDNNGTIIDGVPHYTQFTNYKTACETIATVSLLEYFGVDMTIERFLTEYLPVAPYPCQGEDGELHGESPYDYFLGDPLKEDGYGCFSGAIATGVNKIQEGLAQSITDTTLDYLCENYIDKGEPVVIWATMGMRPTKEGMKWILPNGEWYVFMTPEHALVLVGYDDYGYYFSDSLQWGDVTKYGKAEVETAFQAMGSQAVVLDTLVLSQLPEECYREDSIQRKALAEINGEVTTNTSEAQ